MYKKEKDTIMIPLDSSHIRQLEASLASGTPIQSALPLAIGNTSLGDGLWRFFSDAFPAKGILGWNESSGWRDAWGPILPEGLFSFGEDVSGNQLVLVPGSENALLWHHEDGQFVDLWVPPVELLSTVLDHGIEWIDFYANGSSEVLRAFGDCPADAHLHWVQPLILGGQISLEKLSMVKRDDHLVGHARLWFQLKALEPGTSIRLQPLQPQ